MVTGGWMGIVSRRDVLKLFRVSADELRDDVQRLLADPGRVTDGHLVEAEVQYGVVTLRGTTRIAADARRIARRGRRPRRCRRRAQLCGRA